MKFYLGTHRPHWLRTLVDVPLFVSIRRLRVIKSWRPATTSWALDSGGFTEIGQHGEWRTSAHKYAAEISRARDEIGLMDWAAPQDWMCEPQMLTKTGLTVQEHQRRTIVNYLDLKTLGVDVIPVLQGWRPDDYLRHVDQYTAAGVDLETLPTVGLGSVCRRQATGEAFTIVQSLQPLRLHGFGMKKGAIAQFGSLLASCDSMAWSFGGRKNPDDNCPKKACNNCMHYALNWRDEALSSGRPSLFGWTGDIAANRVLAALVIATPGET